MSEAPTKLIVDCSTGKTEIVALTAAELAERDQMAAKATLIGLLSMQPIVNGSLKVNTYHLSALLRVEVFATGHQSKLRSDR